MTTPYWAIVPGPDETFQPPPRDEYFTLLSWLAAWPPRSTVLLEGHDGARSWLSSVEDLIDALAMAPLVHSLLDDARQLE